MTMTILEWGAVGELIGGAAVIVTLIYLAFQLRQNTKSVHAANYYSATRMFNEINSVIIADESTASLARRGYNEPDGLSQDEADRFFYIVRAGLNNFISVYWMYRDGSFPPARWGPYERNLAEIAASPGGWRVIESIQYAEPEFVEFARALRESMSPMKIAGLSGFRASEESG